jgi:AcrR family transcriptional regulator
MAGGLDQIVKKCTRLMARKGYHGTSMRDLSQVTGRSLSGLYHYFENKEELLYLINQRGFSSLLSSARQVAARDLSAEQRLKALIENHVNYFAGHLNEMRVMMFGTTELSPRRNRAIRAIKDEYSATVQKCVADAYFSAFGVPMVEPKLERKTYLLFGMMNWIFGWYSRKEHGTPEELAADIHETFTRGLCAEQREGEAA